MNRLLLRLALVLLGLSAAPAGALRAADIDPALRALLRRSDAQAVALRSLPAASLTRPAFLRSYQPDDGVPDPGLLEVFVTWEGAPPEPAGDLHRFPLGPDVEGVRTTLPRLRALLAEGRVRQVRLSRPLRPLLDRSTEFLGLPGVRRFDPRTLQYSGVTGRGVVVGAVDTGVDYTHPDFRDETGATRIATYWDQFAAVSHPPIEYGFGREYSASDVNRKFAPLHDEEGHGTHVLGIAAGNGMASVDPDLGPRYAGVAPEAVLIPVRTLFTDFGIAAGVHFVFSRAEAMGLPAVVNLSLGGHFGPHDGSTPFERALTGMTGPGRIIVVAAGNAADDAEHAELRFETGAPETLTVRFPRYPSISAAIPYVDVEGWYPQGNRYRVTIRDPVHVDVVSVVFGDEEIENSGTYGLARAWNVDDLGKGSILVELEALPQAGPRATGGWNVIVEPLSGSRGEIDFWISGWYTGGEDFPEFLDHVDIHESLTVPATAKDVVVVGAISTRSCWPQTDGTETCYSEVAQVGDVADYSGLGPTGDGRDKPDLLAPGNGIMSALSSVLSPWVATGAELARLTAPGGKYWILRGTSMAAPHVTGAVALLLEHHPGLDYEAVRTRLVTSSTSAVDARTGESVHLLQVPDAVLPAAQLVSADLMVAADGIHVRWSAGKEILPVEYAVYRGFSADGPFDRLAATPRGGGNPYEVVDRNPELGRTHVYRIAVADRWGFSEDLDTLRVTLPGVPQSVLRAPDPNPARGTVNFRFFLAGSLHGGEYRVDVIDAAGRSVRRVISGESGAEGVERLAAWDLRDERGVHVAAGVYWVRLVHEVSGADPRTLIRRFTVLF